jgi:hypothetical protein
MSSCPVNIVASWNCLAISRSPLILDYGQRPRGQPRKQIVKVDTVEEKAQLLEHLRQIQTLRDLSER